MKTKPLSTLRFLIAGVSLLAAGPLWGQSVLEQYIREGLEKNARFLQEALAVQDQELAHAEAKSLFLPSLQFQASYTLAEGGRTIDFPVGDLLNPVYGTLNQLTASDRFPTIANVNEQFLPNDFHETKLRLVQPLFNTDIYYNRLIQQELIEVADAKKEAYRQELVKEIKIAYYNYLLAESAVAIYRSNEEPLQELVRFNELRFQQDLITQDEVFRANYQSEQLQADLSAAQAKRETARVYFNFLLNRNYDASIEVDSTLEIPSGSPSWQVEDALVKRSEITQIQAAQAAQQQAYKLTRANRFLPEISAVGDLGYQGFGYTFDNNQDYWLVNLSLQWDLFSGSRKRYASQRSRIQLETLASQEEELKSQIALEVVRAGANLQAARERHEARVQALSAAERTFGITRSRYRESQVLLIEYLDAQSAYLTAQLEQAIAYYQWLAAQATLERTLAYQ